MRTYPVLNLFLAVAFALWCVAISFSTLLPVAAVVAVVLVASALRASRDRDRQRARVVRQQRRARGGMQRSAA